MFYSFGNNISIYVTTCQFSHAYIILGKVKDKFINELQKKIPNHYKN